MVLNIHSTHTINYWVFFFIFVRYMFVVEDDYDIIFRSIITSFWPNKIPDSSSK